MGKLKLKKKKDTTQGTESDARFVIKNVKSVPYDEVLAADEEEVTTIEYIVALKQVNRLDGKGFRDCLKRIDELRGGAAGMSVDEKQYASATLVYANPMDILTEMPDVRDRIYNGYYSFHRPAIEARKDRFHYASVILYNTVETETVKAIVNTLTSPTENNNISLWVRYIEFGMEGTEFGDSESLLDYIKSVVGTFAEGNGLLEAITGHMIPISGNLTEGETIDAIYNVLVYGMIDIP